MLQEASGSLRKPQETSGSFRKPQDASGSLRKPQEVPGGPKKPQEPAAASGGLKRPQDASGGPGGWRADPSRAGGALARAGPARGAAWQGSRGPWAQPLAGQGSTGAAPDKAGVWGRSLWTNSFRLWKLVKFLAKSPQAMLELADAFFKFCF